MLECYAKEFRIIAEMVNKLNPHARGVEATLAYMIQQATQCITEAEQKNHKAGYVATGGWIIFYYKGFRGEWNAKAAVHDCLYDDVMKLP